VRAGALGLALLLLGASSGTKAGKAEAGKKETRVSASSPSAADSIEIRLPADLIFAKEPESPGPVVFRHTSHVPSAAGYQCTTCHIQYFKILHPARRTSHQEMDAGKSCGACHDSRQAFGTQDAESCAVCHAGESAPPESVSAPAPAPRAAGPARIGLRRHSDSPGQVAFDHRAHRGTRCDRCHPALFAKQASTQPLDKEAMRQGKSCGACHDGKAAFGVDDSDACERCHRPEGGAP
jgi:c(7)-type cytochrome triheme protein